LQACSCASRTLRPTYYQQFSIRAVLIAGFQCAILPDFPPVKRLFPRPLSVSAISAGPRHSIASIVSTRSSAVARPALIARPHGPPLRNLALRKNRVHSPPGYRNPPNGGSTSGPTFSRLRFFSARRFYLKLRGARATRLFSFPPSPPLALRQVFLKPMLSSPHGEMITRREGGECGVITNSESLYQHRCRGFTLRIIGGVTHTHRYAVTARARARARAHSHAR